MRIVLVLLTLAACGSDDIDAPECAAGQLRVVTPDSDEVFTPSSALWVNKLGADNGRLEVSTAAGDHVLVEFDELVANGDTTQARGYVTLASGLDVGNCETGGFVSLVSPRGDSLYVFELSSLHVAPYCSGAAYDGSITGCYRSGN